MKPLIVHPLKTSLFHKNENLHDFVVQFVPRDLIKEGLIVCVTSKIVSLAEGRLVSLKSIEKKELVQREADVYLGDIGYGCFLTVKNGLLIPSAGIDESNSEHGDYILYPTDPNHSAELLWRALKKTWNLKDLGVLMTDSHTTPLRRGVSGVCLSYAGFRAVKNMIGEEDLFGRELRMTQINYADGLAAAAVMLMGEGSEGRPLAVIENSEVEFSDIRNEDELRMPFKEDLYFPLLSAFEKLQSVKAEAVISQI